MKLLSVAAILFSAASTFAAGRELAPRGSAPTTYNVSNPLVAHAGDRFLTVWPEHMWNLGVHLMGTFSDASGQRITTVAFPVMKDFGGRPLQLIGTGDSYAFFWKDRSDDTLLTDIDLDGRVTRTTAIALPRSVQVSVGWNGSRFFAVAVRPSVDWAYIAEGFTLERSGEIARRGTMLEQHAYDFHIAGDGDGFAVATAGYNGVSAYRIAPDGGVTPHVVEEKSAFRTFLAPIANGDLLVVYTVGTELRASVVSANGMVQARGTLATSAVPMNLVYVRRVNDGHLVTYTAHGDPPDNGIATLIVHADGSVTPAPERAAELAPRVAIWTTAAANASATLTVYTPAREWPHPVRSVATANDATASEPEILSIGPARQTQPILGSANGRALAAWSDIQGLAAFVRTRSVTPEELLNDTIVAPAYLVGRELPWNGSEYLAVGARNEQLLASRVAFDGTPLGEPVVLGEHRSEWFALNVDVVWAGDRWIVVWDSNHAIFFAAIRNGIVIPPKKLNLGNLDVARPALSFNGTTLLLVWNEAQVRDCFYVGPCATGEPFAHAARLTLDGELAGARRIAIPAAERYAVATSGDEFFVLGGTTATVIDASASYILASREIFNWTAMSDVEWDGATYAVALRYRGAVWHLSVRHLDRELNVVDTPRGTTTLPPDSLAAPSIAAGMVGVQEGDAENGARAVVYDETEMSPLPAAPPAPLNVRSTATGDGRFEITWDESPGAELYRVTAFTPGGSTPTAIDVPASQPRRAISSFAPARVIAFNAGGASEPFPRRRSVRR